MSSKNGYGSETWRNYPMTGDAAKPDATDLYSSQGRSFCRAGYPSHFRSACWKLSMCYRVERGRFYQCMWRPEAAAATTTATVAAVLQDSANYGHQITLWHVWRHVELMHLHLHCSKMNRYLHRPTASCSLIQLLCGVVWIIAQTVS